ncbi:hypothetical protein LTR37_007234 [Vermiconidia calcicola]|uniref:Uncharacterized protein n=1 Tax=Vermiconidia calcicola TaxID=1690605 RepID=A0ACC3NDY5_9PEZI|nr:hypothetical protein LTR37_007234 [Vermiconidia calcicola]
MVCLDCSWSYLALVGNPSTGDRPGRKPSSGMNTSGSPQEDQASAQPDPSQSDPTQQRRRFKGDDPHFKYLDDTLLQITEARIAGDLTVLVTEQDLFNGGATQVGLAAAIVRARDWIAQIHKVRSSWSDDAHELRAKWGYCTETAAELQKLAPWNLRIVFAEVWRDVEKVHGMPEKPQRKEE